MCEDLLAGSCEPSYAKPSKRGEEWEKFSERVLNHVETYAVPQYGDLGSDLVTTMTSDGCAVHIQKYASRQGRGARGRDQEKLDMLKLAHWSCMRLSKMEEEDSR